MTENLVLCLGCGSIVLIERSFLFVSPPWLLASIRQESGRVGCRSAVVVTQPTPGASIMTLKCSNIAHLISANKADIQPPSVVVICTKHRPSCIVLTPADTKHWEMAENANGWGINFVELTLQHSTWGS